MMTSHEAAGKLGVTVQSIYHLIRTGQLKASRFSGVYQIDPKDFAACKAGRNPRGRPKGKPGRLKVVRPNPCVS